MALTLTKKRAKTVKINVGEFPYANLMPQSRIDAINRKKAKSEWSSRIVLVAILMVALTAAAFGYKFWNQLQYDQQVNTKTSVDAEISAFADVDRAVSIQAMITENIRTATEAQINWVDLLNRVQSHLPDNSSLKSFGVLVGGTSESDVVAGVLISITSSEPINFARAQAGMESIPGYVPGSYVIGNMLSTTAPGPSGPDGRPTESTVVYTYSVTFNIDKTILFRVQLEEGIVPAAATVDASSIAEPRIEAADEAEEIPTADDSASDSSETIDPNTNPTPSPTATVAPEAGGANS